MACPERVQEEAFMQIEKTLRRLSEKGLCTPAELDRSGRYADSMRAGKNAVLISDAAEKFGALGDPVRLLLVILISRKEMCVCEVTKAVGLTQPMASYQLGILEKAGFIRRRKVGKWAFFSIRDTPFVDAILKDVKKPMAGQSA